MRLGGVVVFLRCLGVHAGRDGDGLLGAAGGGVFGRGEALRAAAAAAPRAITVFPEADARIRVTDLLGQAESCAAALVADGVAGGDIVGVLAPTGPGLLVALFGAWLAGAAVTVLPLPTLSDADGQRRRLYRIADSTRMRHLVADASCLEYAAPLQKALPRLRVRPAICPQAPAAALPSTAPDDLAVVQFTSGTTTHPRGVMLSHRAVIAGLRAIAISSGLTRQDVLVQWMPFCHDMGLFGYMAQLLSGGDVHLFDPLVLLRRPAELLRYMSACRATLMTGMNSAYQILIDAAAPAILQQLDLSRWRLAYNGAEPVSAATVQRFAETFRPAGVAAHVMFPVYGLAEATLPVLFPELGTPPGMVTFDRQELGNTGQVRLVGPSHSQAKTVVSVGRPVTGMEVRLASEHGPAPGDGQLGEIQVRGEAVTSGYLNDAAATAALFHGDWLRTGDLGFRIGADYYVVGRRKEMIIVHGRNYFPEDAETVARSVPGVYRQRAVAVADSRAASGERIAVIAETSLTGADRDRLERQILQLSADELGMAHIIVHLVTPRWLTRTTSGKWQRLLAARKLSEASKP